VRGPIAAPALSALHSNEECNSTGAELRKAENPSGAMGEWYHACYEQ
jgi:hypothetical protein